MKKVIFTLLALTFVMSAFVNYAKNDNPAMADSPVFAWSETAFDFGKIKLNVPVTHEFTFVNKGTAPLVISSVQASCGCTVAEYSKEPIPVGQSGFVKARYNAAKAGVFNKTVTINANTAETTMQLSIKGEVLAN